MNKKENTSRNTRNSNNREEEKQQIKELKQKKKEMEEELDEMQGRTLKGKVICTLVFILTLIVLMGLFVGATKLDIGGISSQTLAPVIGEVPVLRSILPKDLQQKTPKELQAEADAEAQAEAEAALQDYVDTYSAMKPKDAASVFDSMMPDQEDLIVKILEKLTPDQRAAIISKMSVTNAAALTTKMDQNL